MSRPGGNTGHLSDQQVDIIATRLAERLSAPMAANSNVAVAHSASAIAPNDAPGEGVFATVDAAVKAAGVAFRELDGMSLEGRQKIIASMRNQCLSTPRSLHATRNAKPVWVALNIS